MKYTRYIFRLHRMYRNTEPPIYYELLTNPYEWVQAPGGQGWTRQQNDNAQMLVGQGTVTRAALYTMMQALARNPFAEVHFTTDNVRQGERRAYERFIENLEELCRQQILGTPDSKGTKYEPYVEHPVTEVEEQAPRGWVEVTTTPNTCSNQPREDDYNTMREFVAAMNQWREEQAGTRASALATALERELNEAEEVDG